MGGRICPLLGPWRYGAVQFVYARKGGFDPEEQLKQLSKHGVQNMFTTPTALRAMTGVSDAGKRYPQQLRVTCSAGEPLNPEVIRWFREQFGITVLDYYGLTESYPLCGNFPTVEVREGSMGRPVPGWDVQVLDEDEQPLPPGERGEICLRARSTPHYPLGYWNRPEDTKEVFGGDWFHTKDAAQTDEDGYFWYAGRADDVIISAGYRIGPFEVESACVEHPAVREAAVVASPDQKRGTIVKAFIVLAEGHSASDETSGGDQGVRARAPLRLRVPARGRVRRRPAEDADRQDPPRRASRGRAGAEIGRCAEAVLDAGLEHRHEWDVPEDGGRDERGQGEHADDSRREALARTGLLGPAGGALAPQHHPLEQALRAVELEREEREPHDDHRDAWAGDPGGGHDDAGQYEERAQHHHRRAVHRVPLLVPDLALLELPQELRPLPRRPGELG